LSIPPSVIVEAPTVAFRPAASRLEHFQANVARWYSRKPTRVSVSSEARGGSGRPWSSRRVMGRSIWLPPQVDQLETFHSADGRAAYVSRMSSRSCSGCRTGQVLGIRIVNIHGGPLLVLRMLGVLDLLEGRTTVDRNSADR
jgi:hypothetical protein